MMAAKPRGSRKPNFSDAEIQILLEEYNVSKEILQSQLTNMVTNKKKTKVWDDICLKVNACGVAVRNVDDLRNKIGSLKRAVTERKRDQRVTGGGKPLPPAPYEEIVLGILGENSTAVNGIPVADTETFCHDNRSHMIELTETVTPVESNGKVIVQNVNFAPTEAREPRTSTPRQNQERSIEGGAFSCYEATVTVSQADGNQETFFVGENLTGDQTVSFSNSKVTDLHEASPVFLQAVYPTPSNRVVEPVVAAAVKPISTATSDSQRALRPSSLRYDVPPQSQHHSRNLKRKRNKNSCTPDNDDGFLCFMQSSVNLNRLKEEKLQLEVDKLKLEKDGAKMEAEKKKLEVEKMKLEVEKLKLENQNLQNPGNRQLIKFGNNDTQTQT